MIPKPVAIFIIALLLLGLGMAVLSAQSRGQAQSQSRMSKNGLYLTKQAPAVLPPTELADFAAGCFWGVEEEFRKLPGVIATAAGFEGGHTRNPTYRQVCEENTGHAETVRVEYDPKIISYDRLLEVFWNLHDPTTLNRQGPDMGDQYRSVIFYHTADQKNRAEVSMRKLQASPEFSNEFSGRKIVTEIVPAAAFTKAEEYHQQYVEKGGHAYCHLRKKI